MAMAVYVALISLICLLFLFFIGRATAGTASAFEREAGSFTVKFCLFRLRTEIPRQILTLRTARIMTGASPVVVSG